MQTTKTRLPRTLALIFAAEAISSCGESTAPIETPRAGKVSGLPLGVYRVSGSCSGKITLTPTISTADGSEYSYPLIYDCQSRSFEIPDFGQQPGEQTRAGDFTLGKNRYYVANFRAIDMTRVGNYAIFDLQGREVQRVDNRDLDAHDFILEDASFTYMKYVPDPRGKVCGNTMRVELEVVQAEFSGRTLWTWSSRGRLRPEWKVTVEDEQRLRREPRWKKLLRPIRDCFTTQVLKLVDIDTPAAFLLPGRWPLLQIEQNDYAHANSIDWVGKKKNMLIGARHLDTVFIVDRASGDVLWALGGPMSRMTERRPLGDPGGGFSHQHSATIRNNVLYLFDNGNNLPGHPSRIVAYDVDADDPRDARFRFQFAEPDGLRRPSEGHVEPLASGRILAGWGEPDPARKGMPQRAVSIFDLATGSEVFAIDFSPGWSSYRAKHAD